MGKWETKQLNELGDFMSGSGFPLIYQGSKSGQFPFFKVSDLNNVGNEISLFNANNYISERILRKLGIKTIPQHSIVFAKIGAAIYLERKRKMDTDGFIDNNMAAFLSNGEVSYDLMYYLFQLIKIGSFTNTTALPAVDMRGFGKHKVFYPTDTKEQSRIAAVLTAADEAIAASRALVEKYAAVKQGLMRDLLTGEGEPVKIGRLGGRFFRGQGISRAETTVDGVPCIRYGEIYTTYDIVTSHGYSHTSVETARYCKHIQYGDLLFTLSGETAEDIGKTIAYIGNEDVVVGGDLAVLTGHGQNPVYLSYMLNSASARKQKELASTGATIAHINATKLAEITIALPDIDRQNEIADILTAADERLTAERERLRKLEDIKRGLMDDLLTNRVSTDKLQGGV